MLHADWKSILTRAWSVRWMVLAALFSAAEVIAPLFSDVVPRSVFAVLSGLAVGGGVVARVMVQKDVQ
jgi:hypothetical protein